MTPSKKERLRAARAEKAAAAADVPAIRGKTVHYVTRLGGPDDTSGENRYQSSARLTSLIPVTNLTYREHHPEYRADGAELYLRKE